MQVRQFVDAVLDEIDKEMMLKLPTRADIREARLRKLESEMAQMKEETYKEQRKQVMAFSREMEEQQSEIFSQVLMRKILKNLKFDF